VLGLQRRGARAWTPAEDQELGRVWRRGGELAQLGRRLGRSPAALRLRAVKLGLASYAPLDSLGRKMRS
jgi:hypothetical protein